MMKETHKRKVLGLEPEISFRYESTSQVRLPRMRVEIRPLPGRNEGFVRIVRGKELHEGYRKISV